MPGRPLHAWGRNDTTRTPPRLLVLATIPAARPPGRDGQIPDFQWAVTAVARDRSAGGRTGSLDQAGTDRGELADLITALCPTGKRTWLYAHSLAVHLTAAGLLDRLCGLGWVPLRNHLDGPAPSIEFGYGGTTRASHSRSKAAATYHAETGIPLKDCLKHPEINCPHRQESTDWARHLVIADAAAVWPRTITTDLDTSGQPRPAQRPDPADQRAWAALASWEARTLTRALTEALDWWDANDAGNWGKTGATSGWNAMRHRMSGEATFADVTHPATTLERQACYGGRRTLFRFGTLPPGLYEELDFYRAYTVAARDLLLPTGRRASFQSLPLDHITLTEERGSVGIIARCTIDHADGQYPARIGNRVWYPAGTLTTVLAGPDLRAAAAAGHLQAVGAGQWYNMGHTIAPWARWCLDQQENPETPGIVVRMLKHHGRAVIGKTAAHAYAHDDLGPAHHLRFHAEPAVVGPDRKTGWIIDLGGKRTLTYQDGEGDDSFPAILAYVEAYVRVALSTVIDAIGPAAAIQADTDGLIIDATALRTAELPGLPDLASPGMPFRVPQALKALEELTWPFTIREKQISRTFQGTGPQHYALEQSKKRSGIPGNARPDGKGHLTGWTWPSLLDQAHRGTPDTYTPQPWSGDDPPCVAGRWVLRDGTTIAPEAAVTAAGETVLLPWELTAACAYGLQPGPVQDTELVKTVRDPRPGWHGTNWTWDDLHRMYGHVTT